VKELRETQREIAKAITEQTKLLYALQPKMNATGSDAGRDQN